MKNTSPLLKVVDIGTGCHISDYPDVDSVISSLEVLSPGFLTVLSQMGPWGWHYDPDYDNWAVQVTGTRSHILKVMRHVHPDGQGTPEEKEYLAEAWKSGIRVSH
jgi:hypothetical protein